ncbi:MAG: hypothetical protein EOP06_08530 [Proteobacteria bacterium]|nr:MAG: hypothetical protein EOP06_08530 [Pseudomonadota bacterium]
MALKSEQGFEEHEQMSVYFRKSSVLPLKDTRRYYTVRDLEVGSTDNVLPIRVMEGESGIPSRNNLVCEIGISGVQISKRLNAGSAIDLTIAINESRELTAVAEIVELGITLPARATIYAEEISVDQLTTDLSEQVERSRNLAPDNSVNIRSLIGEVSRSISRSEVDPDQKRRAAKQLKELMQAVDVSEAEAAVDIHTATLYRECEAMSAYIKISLPESGRDQLQAAFDSLRDEGNEALRSKDALGIKRAAEKIEAFRIRSLFMDFGYLNYLLGEFRSDSKYASPQQQNLIAQAQLALAEQNLDELRTLIFELMRDSDDSKEAVVRKFKSGITAW